MHASDLTRSEVVHARVVSVVHIVVLEHDSIYSSGWVMRARTDRVNAFSRAGITFRRAAGSRRPLCGGIVDLVAVIFAAVLKGVV